MTTADLFGWSPPSPDTSDFDAFDAANPDIWRLFVALTLQRIKEGYRKFSADDVLHRIRWDSRVAINNNWSAFYARKFHATHPNHDGFFETRRSRAEATC